jgi:hypothetical protein
VIPEAPLEILDEVSEKENDPTRPEKGTGGHKGKMRAKQVHKEAVMLALDQQDEEEIELPLEGALARPDSATESQDRTAVISRTARHQRPKRRKTSRRPAIGFGG